MHQPCTVHTFRKTEGALCFLEDAMKLGEVMRRGVTTVRPRDSLHLAGQIMAWAEEKYLPVVEHGRLLGVLSEHDVLRHRDEGADVATAMTQPALTASIDEEVQEATRRLVEERIGCLPVVDHEKLLGIVTRGDLLALSLQKETTKAMPNATAAWSIMSTEPLVTHFDDYLLDALQRMNQASVRHLPVIDGEERCIGMLSDRDVRRAVGDLSAMVDEAEVRTRVSLARVGDVASRAPIVVREHDTISELAAMMNRFRIGAVPVVDSDRRLVGIVSYLDVIGALTGQRIRPPTPSRHPPQPRVH